MDISGTKIEDKTAEAFSAWATKLIVTAVDQYWLQAAISEVTGYGTSVIGCDAEVGLSEMLGSTMTPDNRPGAAILLFAKSQSKLLHAIPNRVGQALLTCPTVSVYSGLELDEDIDHGSQIKLGGNVRYFGDGFEHRVQVAGRSCWSIPVMDGACIIEDAATIIKAVAGGNILICGKDQSSTLASARRAVEAVATCPDVITPFPAGVVRSGSKVGARYKGQIASTNEAYCPTLRRKVPSLLNKDVNCVLEIIIDGLTERDVTRAMRSAIQAACGEGIVEITAASYKGKLGKIYLNLHEVLAPLK